MAALPDLVRLVDSTDERGWDALATKMPGGTPFHRSDFLDLQERVLGVRIGRLVALQGGVPVGVVPLARRSLRSPRSPWLPFPLLGPAVRTEAVPAVLQAVRRYQFRSGLLLARFDTAPESTAAIVAAAPGAGMRARSDSTVRIDLAHGSVERLAAGLHRTRAKRLRQAVRAGVAVRTADPGEVAALLPRVLDDAYRRRGAVDPYPASIGAAVEAWAVARDDVRTGIATLDGEPVGALVTMSAGTTAIAWVGSVLPVGRAVHAETMLLIDAMRWGLALGCTVFDFAGRVDEQVERYKTSFGGVPIGYATVESYFVPARLRAALGSLSALRA